MGGASLSLEPTGALERRGLFSKFAGRLDGTPGDLSSPLKGDLDLERSRLSAEAAPAGCISMDVHWSVLKWQYPAGRSGHELRWAPPQGWGGESRRGWKWRETDLVKTRECRLVVLGARRLCSHFLFLAFRLRQIPGVAG
ncbi:hypothetical protein MRX96_036810 [Rhipicephalus microplus]